ncbi:MAG: hypothetical protein ACREQL_04865 [Candidatus Binatia bacterium]
MIFCTTLLWQGGARAGELHLTWTDNADDETGYAVERRAEADETFTEIASLGANSVSYTDVGLPDGMAFCYRVRAFNNVGFSPYSSAACAASRSAELFAAVLPSSRSVQIESRATAFATIFNPGPEEATACGIAKVTNVPASLSYQTTDPQTNQPVGAADAPADIPPGRRQTFVLSLTPTALVAPIEVALDFSCSNKRPARTIVGVNTLLFSASGLPVADVVALAATLDGNGIVDLQKLDGVGLFAVGSLNVGASADITVRADTGSESLPLTLTVCETNTATGACLLPATPVVTVNYEGNSQRSFAVFVQANSIVPFDPAHNRVFVRFRDTENSIRGETSVAVQTQ